MASSGTINTNTYNGMYLQLKWWIKSQSIENNQSVIGWNVKCLRSSGSGGYYADYDAYLAGERVAHIPSNNRQLITKDTTLASGEITVTHNNVGNYTLTGSLSAAIYSYSRNCTGSGSWELTQIPRYPSISQSLARETETSLTMSWSSDSTCDFIWYSTDDGATWTAIGSINATNGSYTISGLTAGTAYKVKTSVRRKDSQLWKNSSVLNVSTYAYPYANNTPAFVIGSALTLGIFNPLGHSVTVELLDKDGTSLASMTTEGTSVTGFNTETVINGLYNSIPDAISATYSVRVTYGTEITTTAGGLYQVNATDAAPVIGSVGYADVNPVSVALTGNTAQIIQNVGIVRYDASGLVAKYGASLASVDVTVNNAVYDLTLSGSGATGGNAVIDSGVNVTAVFKLTDSRGLTATKSIEVVILSYTAPSAIATAARHNNFYSETDLNADADYSSLDGKNTITITFLAVAQPIPGQTTPADVSGTLADNTPSVVVLDNNFAWDITITAVDALNGRAVYSLTIARGIPTLFIDRVKSSIGINCFPEHEKSLEVYDRIFLNGDELGTGDVTAEIIDEISGQIPNIFDVIYPIGSIYLSVNSANPSTLFGGTWIQIKDRFLLSAGDTYQGGATGGESTHTLSVAEMPSHTHAYGQYAGEAGWSGTSPQRNFLKTTNTDGYTNTNNNGYMTTLSRGSGDAHNNMPPYVTVYVWQRTA